MTEVTEETPEFKVKTHPAFNLGREKLLFAGTEDDARKFITDNFPRIHVEPGTDKDDDLVPNVQLHGPDGTEHFNGTEWVSAGGAHSAEDEEA